ncbi:hypothetical protein C8F01DRAFT_1105305 [Mycena amicta]|nr:hypothetical protein C8F01DRAFT_1105305 [Mycena amicta]
MDASSPSQAFDLDLNLTFGALQIGILVSYALFGITTAQTYVYYGRFKEDSRWLKSLVAFVWFLEVAHVIAVGYAMYFCTITDFGDIINALQNTVPSIVASVLLTAAATSTVQLFFMHRIYALSQRRLRVMPIILATLSVIYFGFNVAAFVAAFRTKSWAAALSKLSQWGWVVLTGGSLSVTVDLSIAVSLVLLLVRNRRHSGFERTTVLVDKIIAWTVETGVVTSMFSIVSMVLYATMPTTFLWLAVFTVKSRLFSNSLLASLNSRVTLRKMAEASLGHTMTMPQFNDSQNVEMIRVDLSQPEAMEVNSDKSSV